MAAAQPLRRPAFLGNTVNRPKAENAVFKGGSDTRFRPPVIGGAQSRNVDDGASKVAAAVAAEAQKQASRFTERTAAAIEALRLTGEKLAAEARTDALEIGFLVARRILEMELATNPEALTNLVRTAVKRLGESRKIIIHLAPADAQAINAIIEKSGAEAVAPAGISRIEIVPDPSLGRGDCLVEGDLVTVDGRLNARIEELRRVLENSAAEEAP
jgi:flagellar assembly protein FliH